MIVPVRDEARQLRRIILPYAVADYYGVNPEFGTAQDFKGFINAIGGMTVGLGFVTLYSASYEFPARVAAQAANLMFALVVMWVAAQLSPQMLMRMAPPVYACGLVLLLGWFLIRL